MTLFEYAILFLGAIPFIYYFLAIFSATRYFLQARKYSFQNRDFTPPISNLKPVRGLAACAGRIIPSMN